MRPPAHYIIAVGLAAAFVGVLGLLPAMTAAEEVQSAAFEQGKALAFDVKKGNCLACHYIEDGELPGNIGPALVAMKERFGGKEKLRAQIYDARHNNPNTIMPPYGAHGILTDEEIDKVVEFIYAL